MLQKTLKKDYSQICETSDFIPLSQPIVNIYSLYGVLPI